MQYGICIDGLNQKSSSVYSGDDISITKETYSVELSGLRDNTTYYIQVLATNTALRLNTSIVERFATLLLTEIKAGNDPHMLNLWTYYAPVQEFQRWPD